MANFGICSKWYHRDKCEEFEEFVALLSKGDAVQVKNIGAQCSSWSICITDGPKPTLAYRFCDVSFAGQAGEPVGLATLARGSVIRINNSRDKLTNPKSLPEIFAYLDAVAHRFAGTKNTLVPPSSGCRDFVLAVRYLASAVGDRMDLDGRGEWYAEDDAETFLWLLQVGDLVEFNRMKEHSHWAVCKEHPWHESQGMMIHRCGSEDVFGAGKKDLAGTVLYAPFGELARGGRFRINNSVHYKYGSVERAKLSEHPPYSWCYTRGPYDPRSNNSWHYVVRLRYRMNRRANLALRTQWYSSAEELCPLLSVGDIVKIRRHGRGRQEIQDWAVFVGNVFHRQVPEVVYRSRSVDPPGPQELLEEAYRYRSICPPGRTMASSAYLQELLNVRSQRLTEAACCSSSTDPPGRVFPAYPEELLKDRGTCIDDRFGRWIRPTETEAITHPAVHPDGQERSCPNQHDVAHVSEPSVENLYPSKNPSRWPTVKISCLTEFLKGCESRVDNRWDDGFPSQKPEDVVRQVLLSVGQEDPCPCDRFGGVCPHLAFGLRYGAEARTVLRKAFSCWWTPEDLETVESEVLQEGDIVEAKEGLVSHFAVYVGSGRVVHRCDRGNEKILELLEDFVVGGQVRINNFWDGKCRLKKPEDIVQQAMDSAGLIRHFRNYDLTGHRCFDAVCQTRYELVLSEEEISEASGML